MAPNVQVKIPLSDDKDWWMKMVTTRGSLTKSFENLWPLSEAQRESKIKGDNKDAFSKDAIRSKWPKHYAWLVLRKMQRAWECVPGLGILASCAAERIQATLFSKQITGKSKAGSLPLFLALAVGLMILAATLTYTSDLNFGTADFRLISASAFLRWIFETADLAYIHWRSIRALYLAPLLQYLCNACMFFFLTQCADRIIQCLGWLWLALTSYRPQALGNFDEDSDLEQQGAAYPMVLVQIPMCNEREVYEVSIAAACKLDWPRHRLLIQVLDDSTDEETRCLIEAECQKQAKRGSPVVYNHRVLRTGYKAGALHCAMQCDYVKNYEFVAMFDADFQPSPDFLKKTVIHFKDQPKVALVQARWAFVNKYENILTKFQYINLSNHFEVEQQVNGAFLSFFGFNGTAGVWRIAALEDSGGWLDRTTVEDMDVAVRAHLRGWQMVYLNHVETLCELPSSFEAYRKQQHRWHCGPMQLVKLALPEILKAKIAAWKKFNLIFLFFILRKTLLPLYNFCLFCVLLPLSVFIPELQLPLMVVCYLPMLVTILTILTSPRVFPLHIPYLLFENCMAITKFNAMIVGLLDLTRAHEWVVTRKTGKAFQAGSSPEKGPVKKLEQQNGCHGLEVVVELVPKGEQAAAGMAPIAAQQKVVQMAVAAVKPTRKRAKKLQWGELSVAILQLTAAAVSWCSGGGLHFTYLILQGLAFLCIGLDVVNVLE